MAQRVGRGIALLFHDRGTRRGEWAAARPGCTLPPGKTRYPFYRRLGGPQGRYGREEKSRPHRDSILDCPARNQSLYLLSYPAHRGSRICRNLRDNYKKYDTSRFTRQRGAQRRGHFEVYDVNTRNKGTIVHLNITSFQAESKINRL